MKPKGFVVASGAKGAANGGYVEIIEELDVLKGHGYYHAVKEGGITGEGVGAAERLERIAAETMR